MITSQQNTKLLLHCNGADGSTTFTDSSINTHTVNAIGNAQIDTDQYKFGSSSVLFDGSNDYLAVSDSDDWFFDTSDFTIDFFTRFNSFNDNQRYVFCGQLNNNNIWWRFMRESSNKLMFQAYSAYSGLYFGYTSVNDWKPNLNQWYHIAIVRNGSAIKIFINGQSISLTVNQAINSFPNFSGTLNIGAWVADGTFPGVYNYGIDGWIDEFRIVKGEAYWWSNFTPPTTEYVLSVYQGNNLNIAYDNGFFVANNININYGIFKAIYDNIDLLYNIGFTVENDISLIYNLFKLVNNNIQLLQNIGSLIENNVSFQYLIRQIVNNDISLLQDIGFLVENNLQLLYKLSNYVTKNTRIPFFVLNDIKKTLQYTYDIGQTVNNNINFLYNTKAYVSKNVWIRYRTYQQILKDFQVIYNLGKDVAKDFETIYNSIAYVTNDNIFKQNIGSLIDNDIQTLYNSKAYVTKNIQYPYGIQWDVYRQFRTINNLASYVGNNAELIYNLLNEINRDLQIVFNNESSVQPESIYKLYINLKKLEKLKLNLHLD